MEIKYLGHSSFLIKTKSAKVVTDPYNPEMTGIKFPKVEANIITVSHSHEDHNQAKLVGKPEAGETLVFDMPGEFERLGVRIFGFRSFHDNKSGAERGENILYKIEAEGISVLHCGDLGLVPDDSFIDSIGDVDILLVPTGGFYTIDSAGASELVKKIEPSIIIPMHYLDASFAKASAARQKNFGQLESVEEFTKRFGIDKPVPLPKLTVKKEELLDEMKVIVLEI
ncbi:MAG: Zn-dependent hydrolase of the beta-lactamase fold protein [Candidatus Roizmanbacteria bacterium GW2011_GWA2_35_8]|uniref:Zn-dependent hydrolase of the beta-lactamase fold protein n=1 Tax=Candidatus Roizmanbacteria bacterium GW2011_GWA2_35_8 TaxID=1618479 RepID=A0A0G0G4P1_9BACT|nr:MAG: Zn-dependent hydrolase of the beta-lactamase fold protein [Candidatus Roizmanbacteria bacterium GW2011_GWA2_35_8]